MTNARPRPKPKTRSPEIGAAPVVAVLGSLNMDLVVTVERAPQPGQTVTGGRFFRVPGGKGANQAIATARAGAAVTMLGSVGTDPYGTEILALLDASGISTAHVAQLDTPTGTAHVVVEGSGSNSIIVIPDANGAVQSLTDRQREVIRASRFLLLQLEIPLALVAEAAAYAHQNGVHVVLTPAPVQPLAPELLRTVDLMVLNEGEALELADAASVEDALETLAGSVRALIVTRGERGCLYRGPEGSYDLEAFAVEAVDTTAAGDTFVGALSAQLARGLPVDAAIRWASAAAAISVQRWGASSSMPNGSDVDAFLVARG